MISNGVENKYFIAITFTTLMFASSVLYSAESEAFIELKNSTAFARLCQNGICTNISIENSNFNDFIDIKNYLFHMKIITSCLIPFPESMNVEKYTI